MSPAADLADVPFPVRGWARAPLPAEGVMLWWLGQAGFLLRAPGLTAAIDPYLSDFLAKKYAGSELPHRRMMPPPLTPADLAGVDCVLCTHAHSDHMDPDTLAPLAAGSGPCRFVVPRSAVQTAVERGLPRASLTTLDDGECVETAGLAVEAVASAHETLETSERGESRFLGYILRAGGWTIYHSGDAVPYDGLAERLAAARIDLALLPVNGRDAFRRERGIPGNFHFPEAVALCRAAGIGLLIVHHFGMFDFNTVDPDDLRRQVRRIEPPPRVLLPRIDRAYLLTGRPSHTETDT